MKSIRHDPSEGMRDFNKRLRAKIATRQSELFELRGWRRLVRRLRIEAWAWAETLRENRYPGKGVE